MSVTDDVHATLAACRVLSPGGPEWDAARATFNLLDDQRPRRAGARATLPGEILVFGLGVVPAPDAEATVTRQLDELHDLLASVTVGEYPNLVERPADASSFFDAQTWARLRAVKSSCDGRGPRARQPSRVGRPGRLTVRRPTRSA